MGVYPERLLRPENQEIAQESGLLIVLTGPTGAGKDSVMNELLSREEKLSRIVTYTSRPPRPNEQDGVDYHFCASEEFEEMIANEEFLEYVTYGRDYKGTHKDSIRDVFVGKKVIWRIDMSRASSIHETLTQAFPEDASELLARTVVILIGTPRLTNLLERAQRREGPAFNHEEFAMRLRADWDIWQNNSFDHVVMNEDDMLNQAVEEVLEIIRQRPELSKK